MYIHWPSFKPTIRNELIIIIMYIINKNTFQAKKYGVLFELL